MVYTAPMIIDDLRRAITRLRAEGHEPLRFWFHLSNDDARALWEETRYLMRPGDLIAPQTPPLVHRAWGVPVSYGGNVPGIWLEREDGVRVLVR